MPSIVSICNQSLGKLGANLITSIDQDTTEAKLCKSFYDDTVRALLEEYPWTFALKRYELPAKAESPPKPWAAWFLIPPNVLRIINASSDPDFGRVNTTQWQIEGENIISESNSIFIQAINHDKDPKTYSAKFIRAFVARLAAEMSLAITQSSTLQRQLMEEYGILLGQAMSADGQQGRSRVYRSNQLITARVG